MDFLRDKAQNSTITGIAGLVVGLIVGWFVIGWGLWPVEWTDAEPQHLRADLKEDYLRMVIDSHTLNQDQTKTLERWQVLEPGAGVVLTAIQERAGAPIEGLAELASLIQGAPEEMAPEEEVPLEESAPSEEEGQPVEETQLEEDGEEEGTPNTTILLVMCVVTIILGGALAAYFLIRPGRAKKGEFPIEDEFDVDEEITRSDFPEPEGTAPMSQFMTTYMLGDDLFDDSFSIDSPTGEFLGECGVGISESIGIGEPKKVTAFEIWLFDKNDIQTVTKVLMSKHAYSDDTLRTRLSAKGDPFLVEIGEETELETATLRLVTRVVDMSYGTGASPEDSHFDRVTLEFAVWQKA